MMWKLETAVAVCRKLEEVLDGEYHVALAGSVLHKGSSNKDLDIFLYPHHTAFFSEADLLGVIEKTFSLDGLELCVGNEEYARDGKTVYKAYLTCGKRIDFFLLRGH